MGPAEQNPPHCLSFLSTRSEAPAIVRADFSDPRTTPVMGLEAQAKVHCPAWLRFVHAIVRWGVRLQRFECLGSLTGCHRRRVDWRAALDRRDRSLRVVVVL